MNKAGRLLASGFIVLSFQKYTPTSLVEGHQSYIDQAYQKKTRYRQFMSITISLPTRVPSETSSESSLKSLTLVRMFNII